MCQININGMYCQGCANLIKIFLKEASFTDITVSLDNAKANFSSDKPIEEVKLLLDKIFSELDHYSYSDLHKI